MNQSIPLSIDHVYFFGMIYPDAHPFSGLLPTPPTFLELMCDPITLTGDLHIFGDRLGCVNLGEMGLWIGSSHYPTPSTSINPSSTQFSSVRRASWPGAPKASWTGPFVARELDVSLQKCASPRKPMNISTRNPVMSPIMLVHKHRATCSAISTETRTVLHNCSHCPIVEISGHEVSFLPQYRDMFAASKPHFKVSSPPLSYQETSSGRPSSNKNIVYQQQFPS